MNIGIVGYGFVGRATEYMLRHSGFNISIQDPVKGLFFTEEEWNELDYAFICVPTPECEDTGRLVVNIAVDEANELPPTCVPVVRSTVGPDQVNEFPEGTIFMPEFLREMHWQEDVDDRTIPMIVGAETEPVTLLQTIVHDKNIICLSPELACMYKIARNSALAITVAFANEVAEACSTAGVSYPELASLLESDKDLAYTHWRVPGPDGSLGFGGKCLPKDLSHLETLVWEDDNLLSNALYINEQRRGDDGA